MLYIETNKVQNSAMAINSTLFLLCTKCRINGFNTTSIFGLKTSLTVSHKAPHMLCFNHGYKWKQETHYDVLGVDYEATTAEIKAAYLSLSKELHPDLNQRATKQDRELIHQQFVKVNQAYSILSNKRERRTYDLQILIKSDPRAQGTQHHDSPSGGRSHPFRTTHMSFDERAKAMGFKPQDPEFYKKHNNYHKKIVWACLAWIVGGAIVTTTVIMFLYDRHTTELDFNTKKNNDILMRARGRSRQYGTLEEQKDALNKLWAEERLMNEERLLKKMDS